MRFYQCCALLLTFFVAFGLTHPYSAQSIKARAPARSVDEVRPIVENGGRVIDPPRTGQDTQEKNPDTAQTATKPVGWFRNLLNRFPSYKRASGNDHESTKSWIEKMAFAKLFLGYKKRYIFGSKSKTSAFGALRASHKNTIDKIEKKFYRDLHGDATPAQMEALGRRKEFAGKVYEGLNDKLSKEFGTNFYKSKSGTSGSDIHEPQLPEVERLLSIWDVTVKTAAGLPPGGLKRTIDQALADIELRYEGAMSDWYKDEVNHKRGPAEYKAIQLKISDVKRKWTTLRDTLESETEPTRNQETLRVYQEQQIEFYGRKPVYYFRGSKRSLISSRDTVTDIVSSSVQATPSKTSQDKAEFASYLAAYQLTQANISVAILPIIVGWLNGTTDAVLLSTAQSVYADLTWTSPVLYNGPFSNGGHCLAAIEAEMFNSTNTAHVNTTSQEFERYKSLTLASHQALLAAYDELWASASQAAAKNGSYGNLKKLAGYLLPEDPSIMPAGWADRVESTYDLAIFHAPPTVAGA